MFKCIIAGAAGRDFHDFATFFAAHPEFRVVAFTAAQIPFIAERSFPRALAPGYDADIPIHPEERLAELVRAHDVDFVFLAYSDLSHADVMHMASLVQAAGASFALLGPKHTQLASRRPVVAVVATRTGSGKSPLSQAIARHVAARGRKVAVLRHPMPYGDLLAQRAQRFATEADLDAARCSLEEREEYEPYVEMGVPVHAGVDYAAILRAAEADAGLVLWDGGNNDFPFVRPDLAICVTDALRPGHEVAYFPGETNLRSADVVVVSKAGEAPEADVRAIEARARSLAPKADIVRMDLEVEVDDARVRGKRVVVVEDGPTLTHGGMAFGAGTVAALRAGAAEIVDPRPHAIGTIAAAFATFPHLGRVVPALGYSDEQRRELAQTLRACAADVVVDASPARLDRALGLDLPLVRVRYRPVLHDGGALLGRVDALLGG